MDSKHSEASVPFADPPWLNGIPSPYYTDSHRRWQKTCRSFIEPYFGQHGLAWEKAGHAPPDLFLKFAQAGFIVPNLPAPLPVKELQSAGIHELPGGLKLEEFDYLHYAIYTTEIYRCGLWGPASVIIPGIAFGVPPILNFGSSELKQRLLPDLLSGRKRTCIAITEPGAGSDVANIETTAVKLEGGNFYRVNGVKKWISTGVWSDYATTAVRTGGPGPKGISLLVVPLKKTSGVHCRAMEISAGTISGTTYIEFDDVLVPTNNLVGVEGQGFKYILTNFNHERLSLALSATAQARKVQSTTFEYVTRREAFGKRLIDQPVVRHRLAKTGAELEAVWAWVEQLVHAMATLTKEDADRLLGGQTALVKVRAGKVLEKCVSSAQLLLGGNSVTRSGQGELIEMIAREVALTRIPGGSEDVLLDLGTRQLLKLYQEQLKNFDLPSAKI